MTALPRILPLILILLLLRHFVAAGSSVGDDDASAFIDESYRSELGWTRAHELAYYGEEQSSLTKVVKLLETASETFLCRQNDYGQTALHLAVREDRRSIIAVYMDRQICLDVGNNDGDTAFHYAAAHNRYEAARMLLDAGAVPSQPNHLGEIPRDDAIKNNHREIVSLLDGTEPAVCLDGRGDLDNSCSLHD